MWLLGTGLSIILPHQCIPNNNKRIPNNNDRKSICFGHSLLLDAVDVGELSSFAVSTVCNFCMLNINKLTYLSLLVYS